MTVTLSIWSLPVLVTVVIWTAAVLWPVDRRGDQWGFGLAFAVLSHFILAVGATLLTWLIFFFVLWATK